MLREQIKECFEVCRKLEDCYGLKVNDTYSLFILVQEDWDYEDGTLEYFIELNDTTDGDYEPCSYNVFCPLDNFDKFESTIIDYLKDNEVKFN